MNIEFARLQSVSDLVMEVDITSQGVWKSLSLLIQCTDAGLIAILSTSPLGEGDSNFLGAKIPDLLRILKFSRASLSQSKFRSDERWSVKFCPFLALDLSTRPFFASL